MEKLIGRESETYELQQAFNSAKSEFVVIYGRRRVGKTFLVRHFFKDKYTFQYVGAHRETTAVQLQHFAMSLTRYFGKTFGRMKSWAEAFSALQTELESQKSKGRKVIFFDEMPWIDNKQSDFVRSLEYFWNSWAMYRDDIVLVACGSATSWMVDKLIENHGGLHGRITRRIYLHPFSLHECKLYLSDRNIDWDDYQIIQNYMIMGGIPYYLSLLESNLSLQQNVDNLFFRRGALLSGEFDELYNALFSKADRYITIVEALAAHKEGMTRQEIIDTCGISGGGLSRILNNLENCDFITHFSQLGMKTNRVIYKLIDHYTLFYYKFIRNNHSGDENYWMHNFQSRSVEVWEGYSFELVCLTHIFQIKHALGISGIATEVSTWRSKSDNNEKGMQIDLIIKRVDKLTHLCEIKFSEKPYIITADYEKRLKERMQLFTDKTGLYRGVVQTFVTPFGLVKGKHTSMIHSEVTGKDLFAV